MNPFRRSFDVAQVLLDCLCVALESSGNGCPSRRCVVPGNEVDFLSCCGGPQGGQLTINIENVYASRSFPSPDSTVNVCDAPYEVVVFMVTLLRCVPVGDIDHGPSCEQLSSVAATTFMDHFVMREALRCCLENHTTLEGVAGFNYLWVFDEHPTIGPEGGCVGSQLRIFMGLGSCHECEAVGL